MIQIDILDRPIQVELTSPIPATLSGQFGTPGPIGPSGPQQVYFQTSEPAFNGVPWLWFETDGSSDVVNLWINDGNA